MFVDVRNDFSAKKRVCIAVAKDEAFSFYYPTSLEYLEKNGAKIIEFSPLRDKTVPEADGLIFGGGFPENVSAAINGEHFHEGVYTPVC